MINSVDAEPLRSLDSQQKKKSILWNCNTYLLFDCAPDIMKLFTIEQIIVNSVRTINRLLHVSKKSRIKISRRARVWRAKSARRLTSWEMSWRRFFEIIFGGNAILIKIVYASVVPQIRFVCLPDRGNDPSFFNDASPNRFGVLHSGLK